MGIEVLNLINIDAGIFQRHGHGTTWAVNVWCSHVVSISTHAKADDFGVNLCAARLGVLVFFQHDNTAALAQDKTITVFVPGARRCFGIFITGGQGARRCKTTNAQR